MRINYEKIILSAAVAALLLLSADSLSAAGRMVTYVSGERNGSFAVTLPASWKQSILSENDITLYTYSGTSNAFFSVKILKNNSKPVSDIQRAEFLSLLEKDHRCIQILNTDDYVTFIGTKSRISVYEYIEPKSRKRSLIRTYFLKSGIFTYIFNCSAPIPAFYEFETAFSSILSSISFNSESKNRTQTSDNPNSISSKKPIIEESASKAEETSKATEESTPQTDAADKKDGETVSDDIQKENPPEVKSSSEQSIETSENIENKEKTTADEKKETADKKSPPPYSSTTTIP